MPNELPFDKEKDLLRQYRHKINAWVQRVEKETENSEAERESLLKLFRKDIDMLFKQNRKVLENSGGLGGTIGRQILHRKFRNVVEKNTWNGYTLNVIPSYI